MRIPVLLILILTLIAVLMAICDVTAPPSAYAAAVTGKLAVVSFGTGSASTNLGTATTLTNAYRDMTWGDLDLEPVGLPPLQAFTAACDGTTTPILEQAQSFMIAAGYDPLSYFRILLVVPSMPTNCNLGGGGWGDKYGRYAIIATNVMYGTLHEIGHTLGLNHGNDRYSPMNHVTDIGAFEKAQIDWFLSTGAQFVSAPSAYPDWRYAKFQYDAPVCIWSAGCEWRPSWLYRAALLEPVTISPIETYDAPVAGAQLVVHTRTYSPSFPYVPDGFPDYFWYAEYQATATGAPFVVISEAGAPNQNFNSTDPLMKLTQAPTLRAVLTLSAPEWTDCDRLLKARLTGLTPTGATVVFEAAPACPPPPPPPPPQVCIKYAGKSGTCKVWQ